MKEKRSKSNKEHLVPNSNKITYQVNTYMHTCITNCDFIVLSQVNEISLTVNKFDSPNIFLLTVNSFINGK